MSESDSARAERIASHAGETLRQFLEDGWAADNDRLHEAVELLVRQGRASALGFMLATELAAGICNVLDAEIDECDEQEMASEWQLGYSAGRASALASASHLIGHVANAAKAMESAA